jgi:myo-inositol-1(or 4)-monophosphatase
MSQAGELLDVAVAAAAATVDLMKARVGRTLEIDEKSTATDLVTHVDREAEELIVGIISASRPNDGIIGEEGTGLDGTSGVNWIIDPIDGTTNFIHGYPGFAVSIAAELDGQLAVGVVGDPMHGETFCAVHGGGAFLNGSPIAVSGATDLSRCLVATGFGYDPARRRAQAEVVVGLIADIADIRRMGSAAVDLCSVACGRVDAYFERGLNRWDYAAGVLIAAEAGAVVTDLDGGAPSRRFTLAASPDIAGPLGALLKDLRADQI